MGLLFIGFNYQFTSSQFVGEEFELLKRGA